MAEAPPAQTLIETARRLLSNDPAAALQLLRDAPPPARRPPFPFHMLLARAALAAGEPALAQDSAEAALASAGPKQGAAWQLLGEIHMAAEHWAQAANALAEAVRAGLAPDTLPLRQRTLLAGTNLPDDLRATLEASFPLSASIGGPGHYAAYAPVPKNGCTILKATLVMNGPLRDDYLASGETIHTFCGRTWPKGLPAAQFSAPHLFRFAILRDPARRLLSAYLNKFIGGGPQGGRIKADKNATIRSAQRLLGLPDDPDRSISFEEFCLFLAQAHDAQMNEHWMPQHRFTGTDLTRFDHTGTLDHLDDTLRLLETRLGWQAERDASRHNGGSTRNTTRFDENLHVQHAEKLLPNALKAYRSGAYPAPSCFLTDRMVDIIATRYDVDGRLYAQALDL